MEINGLEQTFALNGYRLKAFRVNHNVTCYGYTLELDRAGRFQADRAKEQNIPLAYWNRLQKGETIEAEGRIFTPDMVLESKSTMLVLGRNREIQKCFRI